MSRIEVAGTAWHLPPGGNGAGASGVVRVSLLGTELNLRKRGGLGLRFHRANTQHSLLASTPAVLVLHGLWNGELWVQPLVRRLVVAGFDAKAFGYQSIFSPPQVAIQHLAERLRSGLPTHLVGHSLGGLIALETLRRYPDLPVPRLVCLGSPLQGSRTVRALRGRGWSGLLGRSGALLDRGCQPWQGATQVGMVAGEVPRGIGRLLADVGEDSDGTVALVETRLPGLADHCCVRASHTGLAFSPQAARQTIAFLRNGRFQR